MVRYSAAFLGLLDDHPAVQRDLELLGQQVALP